jgi:hypothetical protein
LSSNDFAVPTANDFNEIETATGNATIESMREGLSTLLLLVALAANCF